MKIGIIVHSDTGNTLSVADRIKDKLTKAGHKVKIERVRAEDNPKPGTPDVKVKSCPDVGKYDALVFGAPVNAFSLSPTMKACLDEVGAMKGKKVVCYVTKALRFHWTGGNRAIKQMRGPIEAKGGKVVGTSIVIWKKSLREKTTAEAVENIGGLF
jgi:flavodoxin